MKSADQIIKEAKEQVQKGDISKAANILVRGVDSYPENITMLETAAEIFMMGQLGPQALYCLEQSFKLDDEGKRATRHFLIGQLLDAESAVEHLTSAFDILTSGIDEELSEKEMVSRVGDVLCALLETYITDLAENLDENEGFKAAVEAAVEYLEDNSSFDLCVTLGDCYLSMHDGDSAVECLEAAWERFETDFDECNESRLFRFGQLLVEIQQEDKAIEVLNASVSYNEDNIEVLELLGSLLLMNNDEDALEICQKGSNVCRGTIRDLQDADEVDTDLIEYFSAFKQRFEALEDHIKNSPEDE
ncbi:hypothetical protein PCE1_001027 [Barthelona sp. PCE]